MRKTAEITITADGRDKDKTFIIKEMSAADAEEWAMKAFLALSRSGVDIPENVQGAGLAGIAILGLKTLGGVNFADAKVLMDEMFKCVTFRPDKNNPNYTRPPLPDDIEEVSTRLQLRSEIFALHTGFFLPDIQSKPISQITQEN
jgi:hypothetical protein